MSFVRGFVVVEFNVDVGQVPVFSYPPDGIDEVATKKISYLALPDSNTSVGSDIVYTFRFRRDDIPLFATNALGHSYSYGFSFFRQRRDSSVKRGFVQKAVVIVTDFPFPGLFKDVVRLIGSVYFEADAAAVKDGPPAETCIIAAFHEIQRWPTPIPGVAYKLPLMGTIIDFTTPFASMEACTPYALLPNKMSAAESLPTLESVATTANTATDTAIDTSISMTDVFAAKSIEQPGMFQEVGLYSVFRDMSPCLWYLWQLAITSEPLMVMAASPERCGDAVLAIVSLISPLVYCADFRPYFTLYDRDFEQVTAAFGTHAGLGPKALKPSAKAANTTSAKPVRKTAVASPMRDRPKDAGPMLLGATNPFFIKALDLWPNTLWLGSDGAHGASIAASVPHGVSDASPGKRGSSRGYEASEAALHVISAASSLEEALPKPGDSSADYPRLLVREPPLVQPDASVLAQLLRVRKSDEVGRQLRLGGVGTTSPRASNADTSARQLGPGIYFESERSVGGEVPGVIINNGVLRQHFRQLTQGFLKPFDRYFHFSKKLAESIAAEGPIGAGESIPKSPSDMMVAGIGTERVLDGDGSRTSRPAAACRSCHVLHTYGPYDDLVAHFLPAFNEDDFLRSLDESGGPQHELLKGANWRALYERFIASAHFHPWFNARRRAAAYRIFEISRTLRLAVAVGDLIPRSPYIRYGVDGEQATQHATEARAANLQLTRLTRDDVQRHQDACVSLHNKIVASFVRDAAFLDADEELLSVMREHISAVETALPSHLRSAHRSQAAHASPLIHGSDTNYAGAL